MLAWKRFEKEREKYRRAECRRKDSVVRHFCPLVALLGSQSVSQSYIRTVPIDT